MSVRHHTVRPGETVNSIARANGISELTLASYNSIPAPCRVHPDMALRLTKPTEPLPPFTSSVSRVTATWLGSSYRAGCPVGPASPRSVKVTHYNVSGTASTVELIVHANMVDKTVATLRQLYFRRSPVERMDRINHFKASSDDQSMAANNLSAFNCRPQVSGSAWSQRADGRAIDINPIQNPYSEGGTVLPAAGKAFTNRNLCRPGMLPAAGGAKAFTSNGFYWGGGWRTLEDYQHFSTNKSPNHALVLAEDHDLPRDLLRRGQDAWPGQDGK